jgi:hypothetical protein
METRSRLNCRTLHKLPIKLAAILVCFYCSSIIIPEMVGGVMAMLPFGLITLAFLLVVFW